MLSVIFRLFYNKDVQWKHFLNPYVVFFSLKFYSYKLFDVCIHIRMGLDNPFFFIVKLNTIKTIKK